MGAPNDLTIDSYGNVIFTCYNGSTPKIARCYVCALNSNGAKKIITDKYISNGVAVSPEGKIIREIKLAGKNPTNCAFLPDGGLLVTEDERDELLKINIKVKPASVFRKTWLP